MVLGADADVRADGQFHFPTIHRCESDPGLQGLWEGDDILALPTFLSFSLSLFSVDKKEQTRSEFG